MATDQRSSNGGRASQQSFFVVRWYLRNSLSLCDVEELLEERGLEADHTKVWRWVRRYLKPTNKSLRVDETYVKVKGRWCYLYGAIDSAGCRRRTAVPQGSERSISSTASRYQHGFGSQASDQKILAVPNRNPRYDEVHTMDQIYPHVRREIEHFFTIYKELEGRVTATQGWDGPREARRAIQESRKAYLDRKPGSGSPGES